MVFISSASFAGQNTNVPVNTMFTDRNTEYNIHSVLHVSSYSEGLRINVLHVYLEIVNSTNK